MSDNFSISIGAEFKPLRLQIGTQLGMVFDDAVVHNRDLLAAHVRMGIALSRHTMGGPARVRDPQRTLDGALVEQALQLGDLTDRTDALQARIVIAHGDAGRVVSPVFEPTQTLHQDGYDVAFGDGPYDAAHVTISPMDDGLRPAGRNPDHR